MIQKLAIITLLVLAVLAYDTPLDDCYNYRLPSDWCSISVEGTNVTVTDCVNDELFTTVADTAQILRYDNHNIYLSVCNTTSESSSVSDNDNNSPNSLGDDAGSTLLMLFLIFMPAIFAIIALVITAVVCFYRKKNKIAGYQQHV